MNPTATTYCGAILEKMDYDTASGVWERDINGRDKSHPYNF